MGRKAIISLFADVPPLKDPEKSVPAVLSSITFFSALSGYKVKENLFLNPLIFNISRMSVYSLPSNCLRYLGISADINKLFDFNYSPLIYKIKNDLNGLLYQLLSLGESI